RLWNVRLDQSALAPENLTTFARSASRACILGSARPALISLLSLSTTSVGVFFGAPIPVQKVASNLGTKSLTVGICSSASESVALAPASARSLPALTYSIGPDVFDR